jgi:MoaA/NifB/PqqE/SkfB family radical SAM enzyme
MKHDEVRGVPRADEKAWASLEALRAAGITDLGIGFTMVAGNEDHLLPLYDKAMAMGLEFTSTIVHSSPIFFGDHNAQLPDKAKAGAVYEELRRRQLRSGRPKNWFRAYFTAGLRDLARGAARPIDCRAGTEFFYLDPYGVAFPCHIRDWPLGNLDEGYDRLLAKNEDALRRVETCDANCWMTCTVAPMMRADLTRTAVRVALDRARATIGWF